MLSALTSRPALPGLPAVMNRPLIRHARHWLNSIELPRAGVCAVHTTEPSATVPPAAGVPHVGSEPPDVPAVVQTKYRLVVGVCARLRSVGTQRAPSDF